MSAAIVVGVVSVVLSDVVDVEAIVVELVVEVVEVVGGGGSEVELVVGGGAAVAGTVAMIVVEGGTEVGVAPPEHAGATNRRDTNSNPARLLTAKCCHIPHKVAPPGTLHVVALRSAPTGSARTHQKRAIGPRALVRV